MDKFPINSNILYAIKLLEENGFEAYIVGGAVRDYLLGLSVVDYDISTNATLEEAKKVFKDYKCQNYISKGITMGVKLNHTYFELSTYKGNTIIEDLKMRDFSLNSLAYHPDKGLIDPYNGKEDLLNKTLRCVRTAEETFTEDPIRILRAIRFHATKNLKPEKSLYDSMVKYSHLLNDVKKERIRKEFDAVLLSDNPAYYIREYKEIFAVLIPKLRLCFDFDQKCPKWHNLDVFSHIMKVVSSTKADLALRMAALFHDIGKPDVHTIDDKGVGHFYNHAIKSEAYAKEILLKYCYNHKFIERVCKLIYYHDYPIEDTDKSVLSFLYQFGTDDLDIYFNLKKADILGQRPELNYRLETIDLIYARCKRLIEDNQVITYKNLRINGDILKEIGYKGTDIGLALEEILKLVIKKQLKNDPEKLYNYAKEQFIKKEEK